MICKPFRFLSSIAFAVVHYSIMLRLMLYNLPTQNAPRFDSAIYIFVCLSLLILGGYLINRFFEKPIMAFRNSSKLKRLISAFEVID